VFEDRITNFCWTSREDSQPITSSRHILVRPGPYRKKRLHHHLCVGFDLRALFSYSSSFGDRSFGCSRRHTARGGPRAPSCWRQGRYKHLPGRRPVQSKFAFSSISGDTLITQALPRAIIWGNPYPTRGPGGVSPPGNPHPINNNLYLS